ncbi:NADH-ubiquinone oxidoreductase 78 kDa subunit, mitochondrial [Atractiella rhizophila]|nr:NADH-ubiquinone oxidoreductase 78 kDa subunit, mitochondrial [Atractiella rhizophila]
MLRTSLLRTSGRAGRTARGFSSTAKARAEIELEVDGKKVKIEQGSALIQACEKAGSSVPRFCYHDRLNSAGNCRMCLVEVERAPKPIASCAQPAMPGSKVWTNTPLVHKAREGVMEFLLMNHPLDCPICDQGGECDLQDQSMRYGADRGRFHEVEGKRAVENKNFGPLVKTIMNRCIHCTRCVRFANDVAGIDDLGTSGRGNDMQIGTYVEKTLNSEMSGNIADLCPVGALTHKPYSFTNRPWELKKTESVDVLDAVGSNIRIDSYANVVKRVQPKTNDFVNEEWINDKTRYSYDALTIQRLTTPLVKKGNKLVPASWPEALASVAQGLRLSNAKGDEIKAVAGGLADTESLVVLKDLINTLGSENVALDGPQGDHPPAHGVDFRSNYSFNTTIAGVEHADYVLLIGTNPRHEAAIINSRLRKSYLNHSADFAVIGEDFNSIFQYEKLGTDVQAVKDFFDPKKGVKTAFGQAFRNAKKPLIILGSGITEHGQSAEVFAAVAKYVDGHKEQFMTPEWKGLSFLQRLASRTAAYDIGFVPTPSSASVTPKFIYLLNSDDFDPKSIPKDAFVVYQGHHGDQGASYADVVLPGAAYTEKAATWVNTEGRTQLGRVAVTPPGASREDWKIIRALGEVLGVQLPYDDTRGVHERMWQISPTLIRWDDLEPASEVAVAQGVKALSSGVAAKNLKLTGGRTGPFPKVVENFYATDVISRTSIIMSQCTKAFVEQVPFDNSEHQVDA